ncbi:MAG: hypothetical protein ACLQRM_16355 [Acidimicrobiales bacterium]
MAPAKTIYVKDSDVPLWERYETAVKEWQAADSVSALISEAMRQYLDQFGDQGDGLYVKAPDEDLVTFGINRSAILERTGSGWTLSLDLDVYGQDAYTPYELGRSSVREAVADARRHMARVRQSKGMERIEVENGEYVEAFTGRWLVEPDAVETRASELDYATTRWDAGAYWGVALTKRGRIAVTIGHCNGGWPSRLAVYDNLDAAAQDVPASIIAYATAELTGTDLVIERDI